MIDHTDQLVVVTTTRADHAEAGALMMEALRDRDEHSARLVANSVGILSVADPKASSEAIARIQRGYARMCREVATIPYDHAMVDGAVAFDNLKHRTRKAWLRAGAYVGEGLRHNGDSAV
jgi:MinD-like ATPase involved in chromosome partitioning or flagellar assembly